jgi:hypothetical protein
MTAAMGAPSFPKPMIDSFKKLPLLQLILQYNPIEPLAFLPNQKTRRTRGLLLMAKG